MPWSCLHKSPIPAMRQARRAPTHISLAIKLPALQLPPSPWPRSDCSPLLHGIPLHNVKPANGRTNVAGETVAMCRHTEVGLPTQLDCRQQLQNGQHCWRVSLVHGVGAQDGCAISLLKSLWPVLPLSVLSSSHGISCGQIRCSSDSPAWNISAPSANTSVNSSDTRTVEQLWELYFADASQWWDNRVNKKNPRSPDFKHKMTRRALWIDSWSTPTWVRARLNLVTQGKWHRGAGYGTRIPRGTAQGERAPNGKNGKEITVSTSTRELRQSVQGGGGGGSGSGSVHLQNASTTSEAIAILKNRLEKGISIDLYIYVEVLKLCLKQKDLKAAKQVHEYIIESGMDQNTYVGNLLLSVYTKCGKLEDARRVFDALVKKSVVSWTIMIGGYAERNYADEAMRLFNKSRHENVQANEITYLSILKACASPSSLRWGKEVHAHIKDDGFESDIRVGSALVKMYAKCGCMKEARQAFENLTNHDVVTWNVMIGAYAESGCGEEAYRVLLQMRREGFTPNAITYLSILNACASSGALEWLKEVHRHVVEGGFESNLRVANALVHMYSKSGSIDDARLLFNRMEERDVITWTVMIGAYAESGYGEEAYRLFLQMKRKGFKPDAITYVSILNASANAGASKWGNEVHRHAVEGGFESDLCVGNALVHMYSKSGSIDDARLVFDRIEERDVITWNVMIGAYAESGYGEEAYRLFLQMKREGFKPDAITYVSILNACASAGALNWVKEVHRHVVEGGFESDVSVRTALIHMYAKSGSIGDARVVFDRMGERNVITWTAIIGAYAESGCGEEAYRLFLQMKREGFTPNAITYVSILNACASAGALKWVKDVHRHVVEGGFESNLRVGNALVHMYSKSGSIDDARLVFDRIEERDVITWNVMIGAYAESGYGEEAYRLFLQMKREGFIPNAITYVSILNACASGGALEWVKAVHRHVMEGGFESDLCVCNALVHMYSKSGSIDDARVVFDRMKERNIITWNAMSGGLAQHGYGLEALEVFRKMTAEGVKPDEFSFVAALSACSHAGLVDEGRGLFLAMSQDYDIEPTMIHYACMVDLLARAGHLKEAKLFIGNMPVEPNGAVWGALLGACRTYSNVELGELAAKELLKLEPENASPYVLLSNIYAGAGLWEKVSLVRNLMHERGIRKEPGRSWIEVNNKVHDFVVGDTSHPEAKAIYAELNRLTERIRSEGYIPDTQLVVKKMDEDKEVSLCSHSEKLAIAYGLMHTPHGNPIRVYKNLRVCSDCHTATKLISKVTGREIVARDANRFHHFKDGECSCGDYW